MENRKYLFAYGSNTNLAELTSGSYGLKSEDFKVVGTAYLLDYEVKFTRKSINRNGGVLDVVSRCGSAVPGVIFQVNSDSVWDELDKKEGLHSDAYRSIQCFPMLENGTCVSANTYEVVNKEEHIPPSKDYLRIVKDGLQRFGLPTLHIIEAAKDRPNASAVSNIFVYGTLLRGEGRHSLIATQKPKAIMLAEGRGTLFDLGDYPAMRLGSKGCKGSGIVKGEICVMPEIETVLPILDRVEGFYGVAQEDNLYKRVLTSVGIDGKVRLAWTYLYSAAIDDSLIIESGCWRQHRGCKEEEISGIADKYFSNCSQITTVVNPFVSKTFNSKEELAEALLEGEVCERSFILD